MLKEHEPISKYFGSDAGIWLMRKDSAIALDVMYALAKQAIPCLGIHDSFIVPLEYKNMLCSHMMKLYKKRFHFYPQVKQE